MNEATVKEIKANTVGLARVITFTEKEEEIANSILAALEGMTVEEGGILCWKNALSFILFLGGTENMKKPLKSIFPRAIRKLQQSDK